MEKFDELDGEVTGMGNNQFTLMDKRNGQSFMIRVDSNTSFEEFDRVLLFTAARYSATSIEYQFHDH